MPNTRRLLRRVIPIGLALVLAAVMIFAMRYWFKGRAFREMGDEIDRAIAALEDQARRTPDERLLDILMLAGDAHLIRVDHDKQNDMPLATRGAELRKRLDALYADTQKFDAGKTLLVERGGAILTGYICPIDDSVQYFSLYLPEDYGHHRPWPLLVRLHGHGWFRRFQGHPVQELAGAITVAPHGRGPSDFMYIGEIDALQVIDTLERRLNIDGDRITLIGNSMGGTGSWNLAVRYPGRFAAISPQAGNASDDAWTERWGWNARPDSAHRAIRDYMTAINSPSTFAENLLHVPVYCLHGSADMVVPVDHARIMVRRLRDELGYNVTYREFLGTGHGRFPSWIQDDRIGFLGAQWRPEAPTHVRLKTAKLRHGRAHWIELLQFDRPMAIADIEGRITATNRMELTAPGVKRLRLDLPEERVDTTQPVAVYIDGVEAWRGMVDGGPLIFEQAEPGVWRLAEPFAQGERVKRLGVEGPVDEVFLAPFLVVYGTGDAFDTPPPAPAPSGGEDENAIVPIGPSHREALAFATEWKRRFGAMPRMKADADITAEDSARFNLAIFGHPDANSVLRELSGQLPVRVTPTGIEAGGDTFDGEDVGAIFCYPNPQAPDRLVAVFTATTPEALYQINARFGNWFNWGIFDTRKWFDLAIFDARSHNPETYRRVGFFGVDWSFEHGVFFDGIPDERAISPPQRAPRFAAVPDGEASVFLDDVLPAAIDQMRGAVGFGRSFRGYALSIGGTAYERGLGVRAPSSVTWDIGGRFARFEAIVGLQIEPYETFPPERARRLKTRFEVIGDGRTLWKSPLMTIDKPGPAVADVDIRGVRHLTLKTATADGPLWLHGSATWADPRLKP